MNFLFPGAFFLSAVALAIVALYLRRPRQKSLEVSTLLFWRRIFEREPHRLHHEFAAGRAGAAVDDRDV